MDKYKLIQSEEQSLNRYYNLLKACGSGITYTNMRSDIRADMRNHAFQMYLHMVRIDTIESVD